MANEIHFEVSGDSISINSEELDLFVREIGKLTDDSTASESSIDIEVFVGHLSILPERL